MRNKHTGLFKRIVSGFSALAMLTSNALPLIPITASAENEAHTINVFDIDIKSGADYYSTYTPSDPADGAATSLNNVYVWQAESPNEGHKFVYNIKFSLSGEGTTDTKPEGMTDDDYEQTREAVGEGFIEIKIPAHILRYKDKDKAVADSSGVYPDELEMPVPNIERMEYKEVDGKKVYTTDHQFVYKLDNGGTPDDESDDYYVIYNIKPVSAGVVYEFPIAYRMDKNTWEYQDLGASLPCKAEVSVKSWDKDNINEKTTLTESTREIPVYIDTNAHIDSTVKKVDAYLLTADEAASKMGITEDELAENGVEYRYALWSVTSNISGVTQKYSLELTDNGITPLSGFDAEGVSHTVKGEIVGVKMGGSYTQGDTASLFGLTASGKRTDYVLTRYPYKAELDSEGNIVKDGVETLENAPKDAVYTADNNVTVKLTPDDGQDKSTEAASSALFRFEQKNPSWTPVEENYSANKWGLYNNGSQRVSNKSNVSSYELSKLLEEVHVSGLQYETYSAAHAYGRTASDLNDVITQMTVENSASGETVIVAGSRRYTFSSSGAAKTYQIIIDGGEPETRDIPAGYETPDGQFKDYSDPLNDLDMQRIAAQDIADHYYGQTALDYVFEDKTFNLADKDISSQTPPLDQNDYKIDSFSYSYIAKKAVYDAENMQFSAGAENADLSEDDNDTNNILQFYVYNNGSADPFLVGKYNIRTGEVSDVDRSLVSSLSGSSVVFADNANITGYQIRTSNKYFYVELTTKPSVTLKPSETVKALVDPIINGTNITEKKIALQNTANWTVMHENVELLNLNKTSTDYIADIVRNSNINKKALGEKVTIKGQDGKTYKSKNDTLTAQYELAWQSKISETADGVEVDGEIKSNVPVPQQSGIFYDLLPAHCDIIEGSVNVYVDADGDVNANTKALSPSSFEVLDRIENYNGSGKKLLIVKVNAPCEKSYTLTYVTVHSHEDIADYGSFALNTVAYQTGNADIGNGYADDGGNYAVSMSTYIKGLDPDNGNAKRFIYAEATEDILALFPTSSGIYKKVATKGDPTYRRSGVVHNGENYTYSIRMQNDSSTKARDIAILDSIENYRTVKDPETGAETVYNSGIKADRDWNGTVVSFDLKGIEDKISAYAAANPSMEADVSQMKLILYVGDEIVDLNDEAYSDSMARKYLLNKILGNTAKAEKNAESLSQEDKDKYDAVAKNWIVADNWRNPSNVDLSKVTAFMVYTGENFVLDKGDSMSFTVVMHTPDEVTVAPEKEAAIDTANGVFLNRPMTYNNVYRSFTTLPKDAADNTLEENVTYFYTHYDYTQVEYDTIGTLRFTKADQKTHKPIEGIEFNLSGISDYGTPYDETLISDNNGVVIFKNLERGTYQLIESVSDPDHRLDTTPRTVTVDPRGKVTIVTVDGVVVDDGNGNYTIYNEPRYHGDLEFSKVDSLNGDGVGGAKFTLSGTSIYNTKYDNIEAVSDANGKVVFEDIEKGTYTLTEVRPADGYLPPVKNTYSVTCTGAENLIFKITGEDVQYKNAEYQIKNTPTATMTLQKVDSITKDTLDDAKFTLTADSSLNSVLNNLKENGIETSWEENDGKWVQTLGSGNAGKYTFAYLPEGEYTLTEDEAPKGYAKNTTSYTIKVEKSTDGKRLVIKLPSGMQYIKVEDGDFKEANKDTATYHRLTNDEVYEDGKTVIKSWIGGTLGEGNFPVMHLSSEKPEATVVKVTINNTQLFSGINKSNVTGFERWTGEVPASAKDAKDYSYTDETGQFKVWQESGKVYWWSDADIIYLPRDCKELFKDCNNKDFTNLDLSPFYVDKVNSFEATFKNCQYLQNIIFNNSNGDNFVNGKDITSMKEMFHNCGSLEEVDISLLNTSSTLGDISYMFYHCVHLADFKQNLTTSGVTTMESMFEMTNNGKGKNWRLWNLDLSNFDTSNVKSFKYMFYAVQFGGNTANASNGYLGTETYKGTVNLSSFTGESLENMYGMFENCCFVDKIDLSSLGNCPKLTTMERAFFWCIRLRELDLSNFSGGENLNNVKNLFATQGNGNYGDRPAGLIIYSDPWVYDTNIATNDLFSSCRIYITDNNTTKTSFSGKNSLTTYANDNKNGVFSTKPAATSNTNSVNRIRNAPPVNLLLAGSSGDEGTGYNGFSKDGDEVRKEITAPTDVQKDSIGKKSFTFEYKTAETGTPVDGKTDEYTVDETVYMIVNEVIEEGGKYYTVSQKYKYSKPLTAKWTQVSTTAPAQWYCEMRVFNADDEMFAWENTVSGFVSTADDKNPIKTVGRDDKPVITNSKDPVGSLELSKKLTGGKEKYSCDTFRFKVTMKNADGTAYKMLPFDKDGVAYFDVKPNAKDDDKTVISGIPEGCTYEVEEVGMNGKDTGLNGEYVSGSVTYTNADKKIVGNKTEKAEIENSIITKNLSLTKNIELWKKTKEQPDGIKITDTADTDYAKWKEQEFTFTVTFDNLVMGQEYSYEIDGTVQADKIKGNDKSAETVKTITIKGGQTVKFLNIPVGTKYTIVETSEFEETDAIKYSTSNDKNTETPKSTGEQVLSDDETVTFTNTKTIDETQIVETVDVTVNKEWYDSYGVKVNWTDGVADKTGNYPSFLKVYLGRALKVGDLYLDVETGYTSYSLKANEDWNYTFTDLPKSGEVTLGGVTTSYDYVYFVSEVVPIGFKNINTGEATEISGGNYFVADKDKNYTFTLKNQEEATHTLSICKLVTGNMGSKAKDFTFEVEFRDSSGKLMQGTGFTMRFTDVYDTTYVRNRTYTLENGKVSIDLPHGKKVQFLGIPEGTKYTITEVNSDGYKTVSGIYTGYPTAVDTSLWAEQKSYTDTLIADVNYLYVNDLTGTVPTGVDLKNNIIVLTALTISTWLILMRLKRRREYEKESA